MPELYSDTGNGFNYQKESAIAVGDVFAEAITMTTEVLPAGTYMIAYSFEYQLDTKDKPLTWRVTGTYGSLDEFENAVPAALAGQLKNKYYSFPKDHAGGAIIIGMDFKKDALMPSATINFLDVMIMRVA